VARVVVTDYTFPSLEVEESILLPQGFSLEGGQFKSVESLIPFVAGADAVITQFAPIKAEVIAAMHNARVIVRYGIGVDNVDLEAARVRGIPVCNVPDYCIDEVADHTLAFILAVTRQVVPNTIHIREGRWGLATSLENLRTLRDQTAGIIGFGRIGREVATRLSPFKCRRLVFDPVISPEMIIAAGCVPVSLEELLASSDIVTLHCPSTAKTRKMLNADTIGQMKDRSILVNLARGDLVDTAALVASLESGHLAAAAIDVCDPEPIPLDSPLRKMPQVVCASHIASASPKAVRTLRQTAASIAASALKGEKLPNIVNGL
jgi:D-3-phosphoglycerate dehydrogenase